MRFLFGMVVFFVFVVGQVGVAGGGLFDMGGIVDSSSLDVEVVADWHVVEGAISTRQKLVTICVGELWAGQDYRVPIRMIVPAGRKAKGFHLTGGHQLNGIRKDALVRGVERELIKGGVGLVYTIVQEPGTWGKRELGNEMRRRFIETLNPRYSIQYWGWPCSLMRAVTAAYAETGYFEVGKVALSGGSKNGASPSVAILHDKRMTALHSSVAPIWESPLRLCDRGAWDELNAYNRRYAGGKFKHFFLGGTFGPVYNGEALAAGHSWEEIRDLAVGLADDIFISRNLAELEGRGVDLYFHPGTHDFVAFDVPWGGKHYPGIPIYLRVNSGHGQKKRHKAAERDEQNKAAFLLGHFFEGVEDMLEAPAVEYEVKGGKLVVKVGFEAGSRAESGRIWWIYDRGPDGSAAYIRELFGDENWKEMRYDAGKKVWVVEIELEKGARLIDFYSNHRKTLHYQSKGYSTYISSPYMRVLIEGAGGE